MDEALAEPSPRPIDAVASRGGSMRLREKVALSVAPIVLRITIGVAFLWLGLGRVADKVWVEGEDAAILADLGVVGTGIAAQSSAEGGPAPSAASVQARRLYKDALVVYHAAYPGANESGDRPPSTWPGALAGGNAPIVLAWIGAMTAVVGGGMVLMGLFTRLWAAALMVLMFMSAWLTQMGPAIQSGKTQLGVLPDRPLLDPSSGQELLWQFTLLMAALTLALAGSGALALDRAIFGKVKGGGGHG